MADGPELRISDQDREQAASDIREHYSAGRLDSAEFEERVQSAYAAKTQGELSALSADLPALPPKPPTRREAISRSVVATDMARTVVAGGALFLAAVAIWAITGAGGWFWPKWVLVLAVISIARRFRRSARRGFNGGGGGAGRGSHHHRSYRYEYNYRDGSHKHRHEHNG